MQSYPFIDNLMPQLEIVQPFLPGDLHLSRQKALQLALTGGIPSSKHPTWKYAQFQALLNIPFQSYLHPTRNSSSIEAYLLNDLPHNKLVFINGFYNAHLSHKTPEAEKITITHLIQLAKHQPELLQELHAKSIETNAFFHLINGALTSDGAVIIVPDDVKLSSPLVIYHFLVNDEKIPKMIHPQTYLFMGKNAICNIFEKNIVISSEPAYTNAQTFLSLDPHASLHYYRLINNTPNTFSFNHINTQLAMSSQVKMTCIAFGSTYCRMEIFSEIIARSAKIRCHGLMLPTSYQHIDWVSHLSHNAPEGTSKQIVKSIIGDQGHSSFYGNIKVTSAAQQTNATMENGNLLLTQHGRADTTPQLEILADEVQCKHGASIGQLEDAALFYLQSRGLSLKEARKLLIQAFAQEIFDPIPNAIQENIYHEVMSKLEQMAAGALI